MYRSEQVSLEAVSMRDTAPVHHVYKAFLITLIYKKKEQLLMRPNTLNNLRNNVVWTFALSNGLDPKCICIQYDEGGQTYTVVNEMDWEALRSHRKITRFTITILVCSQFTNFILHNLYLSTARLY